MELHRRLQIGTVFRMEQHILSVGQTLYPIRFLMRVRSVIQYPIRCQEVCQTPSRILFPTHFLKVQATASRTAYRTVCPIAFLAL